MFESGDGGWKALIDGGRPHRMRPLAPGIRARMPIDLLVGTHPDEDHIGGLVELLGNCKKGDIQRALIPPVMHPTGAETTPADPFGVIRSRMLGDHLRTRTMREVLEPLDKLAADLARAIDGVVADATRGKVRSVSDHFVDRLRGRRAERQRSVLADGMRIAAREQLPNLLRFQQGARTLLEAIPLRRQEQFARSLAVAGNEVGETLIRVERVRDLIKALDALEIPWTCQPAPNVATRLSGEVDLWHLAPTIDYVMDRAELLTRSWSPLLSFAAFSINTPLPSQANRLSHVLAIRGKASSAVMLTGDAGFQGPSPAGNDSMADGWKRVMRDAAVLDLPHHGGRWGHFGERARSALRGRKAPLECWVSCDAFAKTAIPAPSLGEFIWALDDDRHAVELTAANQPRPAAIERLQVRDAPVDGVGPDWVTYHLLNDRSELCEGSLKPPITVRVNQQALKRDIPRTHPPRIAPG